MLEKELCITPLKQEHFKNNYFSLGAFSATHGEFFVGNFLFAVYSIFEQGGKFLSADGFVKIAEPFESFNIKTTNIVFSTGLFFIFF